MGILGINNRTENWKTVQHFHGLSDAAKVALVRRLEPDETATAKEIRIELFWCGMRDYVYVERRRQNLDDLVVRLYERNFASLRGKIEGSRRKSGKPRFRKPKDHNYAVPVSPPKRKSLVDNVKNTEVDIVMATPDCLFVGEAKDESDLGRKGSLVLVHQLVRQYVTATILVHLSRRPMRIVPFVVTESGKKLKSMRKAGQVAFMIEQEWLRKDNVLTWGEVKDIRDRAQ